MDWPETCNGTSPVKRLIVRGVAALNQYTLQRIDVVPVMIADVAGSEKQVGTPFLRQVYGEQMLCLPGWRIDFKFQ